MPISTGMNEVFVYEAVKLGQIEIRADGTVWRIKGRRPKQLAKSLPPSAKYVSIKVMRNGRQVGATVQRLVYHHFKGPIPPGLTVNHKDGNTLHNHPDNLELATYLEQTRHAIDVLGRKPKDQLGEKNKMANAPGEAV